jgi:WD40 repeat protein
MEAATGEELSTPTGHADAVSRSIFGPHRQRIATASHDRVMKVWDANTGQEVFTLNSHRFFIDGLVHGPDGTHVAIGTQDGTI